MEQETLEITSSKAKVSQRLLKGMTAEEVEVFIGAYKRSKRVLSKINEYATREAAAKLKNIESPEAFNIPNWDKYVAWNAGYRHAMRIIQDMTR